MVPHRGRRRPARRNGVVTYQESGGSVRDVVLIVVYSFVALVYFIFVQPMFRQRLIDVVKRRYVPATASSTVSKHISLAAVNAAFNAAALFRLDLFKLRKAI